MINNPKLQTNLYLLDNIFNKITKLEEMNKMPNKILFAGPKGSGKSTLAYHLINYMFSKKEIDSYDFTNKVIKSNNKSFILVQNNSHPNFYLIDLVEEKKNIEISQIRKMIDYTKKSTFNDSPKFILIDNVECLNSNSSNALLKVIEEPNENCFFILIHNSYKNISNTLKSRCLTYKINLTFDESVKITNKIINDDISKLINIDLINQYNTPGDFINLLSFAEMNKINLNEYNLKKFLYYLINNNFYKNDFFIKSNIFNFIELYFLKLFLNSKNKNLILNTYSKFIKKNNDVNKFNLDIDSLYMEFKSKVLNA